MSWSDDPQAYLATDRRRALAAGRELPDRVHGAALFVDISGFTPLTEALAADLGPQRGAEEVTALLDRVFSAVLERLHRAGGDVIYFSGDAVTCWLDGDDGLRAVTCAQAMHQALAEVGELRTPSGRVVRLGMKIAVAVGGARRFVVGDPRVQLIDVLAGSLVDRLAAAELQAQDGDVVLDASAIDALGDRVRVRELADGTDGTDGTDGRRLAVLEARLVAEPAPDPVAGQPIPRLPEDVVRPWLLPAVFERMTSGRGELLAELRPAVPLFLRFGGFDHDNDPGAAQGLDDFVASAQRIVDSYGGSTLQLTLGDKGAYLYAVFGSPRAHEDDAARACAAALELRGLDGTGGAQDLSIGIAAGRLRSGTYGHPDRRTFCCLGDPVNLAARLMAAAGPGQVYVSAAAQRPAADRFSWQPVAPLAVKGKAAPVEAFELLGDRPGTSGLVARLELLAELPLLGRAAERELLAGRVEAALAGHGQLVDLVAEAGLGKSRLLAEAVRLLTAGGAQVFGGESPAFGAGIGYAAWREIWWGLFGLSGAEDEWDGPDVTGAATDTVRAVLAAVDPTLVARLPLLGPVLDLAIPDSELTSGFDAKLRKASLEDLLATVLADRAARGPLALVLEDAHGMDALSADLLQVLARACAGLPVILLLARRPPGPTDPDLGLDALEHLTRLPLAALDDDASADLVGRLAPGAAQPLVDRVVGRAQGNPFYLEELVGYLQARTGRDLGGVDPDEIDLPDSLAALVLSRIDALGEAPRGSVKVASVVGRSFTADAVAGVHPDLGVVAVVERSLDQAHRAELLTMDDDAARIHAFRHVIVRDVAYESLPFALRSRLHGAAGDHFAASHRGPDQRPDQLLDLLAYHYGRGPDVAKKRAAWLAAGRAAQARYANVTAIEHFRNALPLVDPAERGQVLRSLGQVLELTGGWVDAEDAYRQALELASGQQDVAATGAASVALAEVARKQGRFAQALAWLDDAGRLFDQAGDLAGSGRVLHLRGTLAAQQGRYDQAREHYSASLQLREQLGDRASMAALLSNLAVIAEYLGDYPGARGLNEQALELREAIGDRGAIAISQNNLGMIALLEQDFGQARSRFEEAMRVQREIGDAWHVAIAQNNLANALRGLGDLDGARAEYAKALEAYRRWDDRWALATVLEDVAVTALRWADRPTALRLLGAAEALRAELGSPRSPSLEAELAAELAPGTAAGDDALLDAGRVLGLDAATRLAMDLCSAGTMGLARKGVDGAGRPV